MHNSLSYKLNYHVVQQLCCLAYVFDHIDFINCNCIDCLLGWHSMPKYVPSKSGYGLVWEQEIIYYVGRGSPMSYMISWSHTSLYPNNILTGSAIFVWLMFVSNRHTDTQTTLHTTTTPVLQQLFLDNLSKPASER